jgi:putative FmdB family regulatory protein
VPTYEFRCPSGHDFERFYKTISGAASEAECPECGKMGSRRMSVGAGLLFKGSGFYLTDYGKNAHRGGAPEKKGEKGESGGDGGSSKAADSGASKAADSGSSKAADSGSAKPKAESKSETKAKPAAESKSKPKPKSE